MKLFVEFPFEMCCRLLITIRDIYQNHVGKHRDILVFVYEPPLSVENSDTVGLLNPAECIGVWGFGDAPGGVIEDSLQATELCAGEKRADEERAFNGLLIGMGCE